MPWKPDDADAVCSLATTATCTDFDIYFAWLTLCISKKGVHHTWRVSEDEKEFHAAEASAWLNVMSSLCRLCSSSCDHTLIKGLFAISVANADRAPRPQ